MFFPWPKIFRILNIWKNTRSRSLNCWSEPLISTIILGFRITGFTTPTLVSSDSWAIAITAWLFFTIDETYKPKLFCQSWKKLQMITAFCIGAAVRKCLEDKMEFFLAQIYKRLSDALEDLHDQERFNGVSLMHILHSYCYYPYNDFYYYCCCCYYCCYYYQAFCCYWIDWDWEVSFREIRLRKTNAFSVAIEIDTLFTKCIEIDQFMNKNALKKLPQQSRSSLKENLLCC